MQKDELPKIELYYKFNRSNKHFHSRLSFMDSFGWYCKKHYFHEKCCDDMDSDMAKHVEDSEFHDLMEIFRDNREFILFCLFLSEETNGSFGYFEK